jgi:alpha-amylase
LPDVILGRSDPRKLINRYEKLSYHALNREKWGQYLVTFLDNHDQTQRFAADASDEQVIAGIGYLLCALGTACIYYGTEQGLNGHGSQVECVREPLFDVAGHTMKSYLDRNCQIYQEIPKIAKIRHDIAALRFGQMHFCEVSSDGHHFALPKTQPCTLAFSRILADQEVLIAYNTSTTQKRNDSIVVDNTLPYNNGTLRFLYGKQGKIAVQKHPDLDNPSLFVQLDLEPMQFVILTNQENGCISNQEG